MAALISIIQCEQRAAAGLTADDDRPGAINSEYEQTCAYLQIPFPRFSTSVSLALVADSRASCLRPRAAAAQRWRRTTISRETPETAWGADGPDPGKPPKPDPATVSVAPATVDEGGHCRVRGHAVANRCRTSVTVHWQDRGGCDGGRSGWRRHGNSTADTDFTGESGGTVVFASRHDVADDPGSYRPGRNARGRRDLRSRLDRGDPARRGVRSGRQGPPARSPTTTLPRRRSSCRRPRRHSRDRIDRGARDAGLGTTGDCRRRRLLQGSPCPASGCCSRPPTRIQAESGPTNTGYDADTAGQDRNRGASSRDNADDNVASGNREFRHGVRARVRRIRNPLRPGRVAARTRPNRIRRSTSSSVISAPSPRPRKRASFAPPPTSGRRSSPATWARRIITDSELGVRGRGSVHLRRRR